MKLRDLYHSVTFTSVVVTCVGMAPVALVALAYAPSLWVVAGSLGTGFVLALAGAEILLYRVHRSLRSLRLVDRRLVGGEPSTSSFGLGRLFSSRRGIDAMAEALQRRVDSLVRVRSEQDAILRSMVEGVIALDGEGRVRQVNQAALQLLAIGNRSIEDLPISQVVAHEEFLKCVSDGARDGEIRTSTVTLPGIQKRILAITASPLVEEEGVARGTLLVMHDVTRVRELENMRREFVANVSHELRTPITSIKGFAETLIDGAMHDPSLREKFLGIISRQAERLSSIFNDLLTLAKLEASGDDSGVLMERCNLRELVQRASDDCATRASARQKDIAVDVDSEWFVFANDNLVEQALVNLLDNAIKYSDPATPVRVEASRNGELTEIKVIDRGPGIEEVHLQRLFQRFYRVDHGRSRQLGGTGLGLAIVKHIAQAHGGKVNVASVVGEGSVFSFFLKAAS